MASPANDSYTAASGATVYGGRIASDALTAALALLSDGEMSANLAINALNTINDAAGSGLTFDAYFTDPTYLANGGAVPFAFDNDQMAYSSPVWMDDKKCFALVGGGHMNGIDGSVFFLPMSDLAWVRKEDGARFQDSTDAAYNAAASAGLPFQQSGNVWRLVKNRSGRFALPGIHSYGGNCYVPWLDIVLSIGNSSFGNPAGNPGGALGFSATTGLYDESTACAGLTYQNHMTFALAGIERVLIVCTDHGVCTLYDPATKETEAAGGWNSNDALDIGTKHPAACLIPDPFNEGRKAAFCLTADPTKCWIVSEVDVTPSPANDAVFVDYANSMPASIDVQYAVPIWVGDYRATNKVTIIEPQNGIWTYDLSTKLWSDKLYDLSAVPGDGQGGMGTWKRVQHMPSRRTAAYEPFGYFDGEQTGKFRVIKLPESVYA